MNAKSEKIYQNFIDNKLVSQYEKDCAKRLIENNPCLNIDVISEIEYIDSPCGKRINIMKDTYILTDELHGKYIISQIQQFR